MFVQLHNNDNTTMSNLTLKPLSKIEKKTLGDLEHTVEELLSGIKKSQYKIGSSLMEIRDSRLYREGHATFEEYCRSRWGMSKSHANRHISFRTTSDLLQDTEIKVAPEKESQTRALNRLPETKRKDAWKEAVQVSGGKTPTAKTVSLVVDELVEEGKAARTSPSPVMRYVNHTMLIRDLRNAVKDNKWKMDGEVFEFIQNYKS